MFISMLAGRDVPVANANKRQGKSWVCEQSDVKKYLSNLMQAIETIARSPDNYGLIHSDAHDGNVIVTEKEL
jgi:Ser/Thr protein kinase RdoA (MazF antagonist)